MYNVIKTDLEGKISTNFYSVPKGTTPVTFGKEISRIADSLQEGETLIIIKLKNK